TMFCFIQTDAALQAGTLDLLTGVCVKRSFDRISVDGQLSTSDTVVALEIVHDGEGARRVGRVLVSGRPEAVEPVARAVANSPLVKSALHGGDANFGRILQAAGQVWPPGEPFVVDLEI